MTRAAFVSIDLTALQRTLDVAKRERTRNNPSAAPAAVQAVYDELGRKDKGFWLLSTNPKVEKGLASNYLTGIMHFAAGDNARKIVMNDPSAFGLTEARAANIKSVCPFASKDCLNVCLVSSGRGGMGANVSQFKINNTTEARIKRQLQWQFQGEAFFTLLIIELVKMREMALKKGLKFAARLNGTSDIAFENIPVKISKDLAEWINRNYRTKVKAGTFQSIFRALPKIQFYDYTKIPIRMRLWIRGEVPPNYYLTFSMSEKSSNRILCEEILKSGKGNVAVPFDTVPTRMLKDGMRKVSWTPMPYALGIKSNGSVAFFDVFDSDEDDLRFLDPRRVGLGKIAGLRFKLPTDKGRKALIEASDFRLKTKGEMLPIISVQGGNVLNPGPGWATITQDIKAGVWPREYPGRRRAVGIRSGKAWTRAAIRRKDRR